MTVHFVGEPTLIQKLTCLRWIELMKNHPGKASAFYGRHKESIEKVILWHQATRKKGVFDEKPIHPTKA